MKKLITHNGGFHADDVFATATLFFVFKEEGIEVERTRDPEVIETGDFVYDVGRVYDGVRFFDHHQEGGAGARENGVPYASFGLIWKHFGKNLVSEEAHKFIDQRLVQAVDALDNGVDIAANQKIHPFTVSDVIGSFNLVGHEGKDEDHRHNQAFLRALEIAKQILERVIIEARDFDDSIIVYKKAYDEAPDKRLVVLEHHIRKDCISLIPEVLYVVHPYHNNTWTVRATRKNDFSFKSRKPLPKEWAGKLPEELQKISGVPDALFCHNSRFIANAKTKEGAIALAKLAIEA
jgi:uncharacterized UPF0160 family protein